MEAAGPSAGQEACPRTSLLPDARAPNFIAAGRSCAASRCCRLEASTAERGLWLWVSQGPGRRRPRGGAVACGSQRGDPQAHWPVAGVGSRSMGPEVPPSLRSAQSLRAGGPSVLKAGTGVSLPQGQPEPGLCAKGSDWTEPRGQSPPGRLRIHWLVTFIAPQSPFCSGCEFCVSTTDLRRLADRRARAEVQVWAALVVPASPRCGAQRLPSTPVPSFFP